MSIEFSAADSSLLRQIRAARPAFLCCCWLFFWVSPTLGVPGQNPSQAEASAAQKISPSDLDQTIDHVLLGREFGWRNPAELHQTARQKSANWIEHLWNFLAPIRSSALALLQWLDGFFRNFRPGAPANSVSPTPFAVKLVPFLTVLLAVSILIAAILFALRLLKPKRPKPALTAGANHPDLEKAIVAADERPDDEWLRIANQMVSSGEMKLAQRAIFLAILSNLASRRLIKIEKWKSNCDYGRELDRTSRQFPQLTAAYLESRIMFERCWYGPEKITREDLEAYAELYESIKNAPGQITT